jgi:parallel beta-helix repeat protein
MHGVRAVAAVGAALLLVASRPVAAATFTVDSTTDAADACVGDGVCGTAASCAGACTLRAAMQEAAFSPLPDTITFAIGSGLQTIRPTAPYSAVFADTIIDGTTQPGPAGWTPCAYPGTPLIEIDGSLAPPGMTPFVIFGNNSTIRGLVINRFTYDTTNSPLCSGGAGIVVRSDDNVIECNLIGTDASGLLAGFGNEGGGVHVDLADGNRIQGNVISENGIPPLITGCNRNQGISITGNDVGTGNAVTENFIGTDVTGTVARGNGVNGCIVIASVNNAITGNVISGNGDEGVDIVGGSQPGLAAGTTVRGNFIGTDKDGVAAIPNRQGIRVFRADHVTIGGPNPDDGNVVSGNTVDGIALGRSDTNTITGCRIGTDVTGTAPIPNGGNGIQVHDSLDNVIGGTAGATAAGACTGPCNVIAYNGRNGVAMNSGSYDPLLGNPIRANRIFRNGPADGQLGIDLDNDGVTPNDAGDADAGANALQNFPVVTSVAVAGSTLTVSGTLDSTPSRTFDVDVFANASCDPSGHGEGATWLGSTTVTTPAGGVVAFTVVLPASATFPGGAVITATATDLATSHTSEFSPCVGVPLDHFSCYKTFEYQSSAFAGFANLTLADRFTSRTASSNTVLGLCAPANKNGEDPTAPARPTHLEGYRLRRAYQKDAATFDLILKDQFGTHLASLYAKKVEFLLVPTAKTLASPPPPPPGPGVDDFVCYRIRRFEGGNFPPVVAPLSSVDQFGANAFTSRRARWLCTPVDVDSQNPAAPVHPDQLLCYVVPMLQSNNWLTDVWVTNRFGSEYLRVQRQNMLCVPARIGCVGACVGGSAPGQPCAVDSHCPGNGTCNVPPCCCGPAGATSCTTNGQCPGSACECS